jgi:hypothetical protein
MHNATRLPAPNKCPRGREMYDETRPDDHVRGDALCDALSAFGSGYMGQRIEQTKRILKGEPV